MSEHRVGGLALCVDEAGQQIDLVGRKHARDLSDHLIERIGAHLWKNSMPWWAKVSTATDRSR